MLQYKMTLAIIIMLLLFSTLAFKTWISSIQNHQQLQSYFLPPPPPPLNKRRPLLRILYWTQAYYGAWIKNTPAWGFGKQAFQTCPVNECTATSNRSLLDVSDVVFINTRLLGRNPQSQLPKRRMPFQIWLWVQRESPDSYLVPASVRHLFNATFTYRRTSDIVMRRTSVVARPEGWVDGGWSVTLRAPDGSRKKMAAWVVSACRSHNFRERVVTGLRRYVRVDVFGRCGTRRCDTPGGPDHDFSSTSACHTTISREYVFYLALENSSCDDYLTEKAVRCLELGIVPVVYGRAAYARDLPPGSYVDVRDFSSAKALADHLTSVANSVTLYREYFAWRERFVLRSVVDFDACEACRVMHGLREKGASGGVSVDLGSFWDRRTQCEQGGGGGWWMEEGGLGSYGNGTASFEGF